MPQHFNAAHCSPLQHCWAQDIAQVWLPCCNIWDGATRWPNEKITLCATMLHCVSLKCCVRFRTGPWKSEFIWFLLDLFLALSFLLQDGLLSALFVLGRKFNKNGELTAQWWSQDSLDGFNAKAKCVENQYWMYKVRDKYPVGESILQAVDVFLVFCGNRAWAAVVFHFPCGFYILNEDVNGT